MPLHTNRCRWRGGRAVECSGLENRRALAGLGSSNLPLSDFPLFEFPSLWHVDARTLLISAFCLCQTSGTRFVHHLETMVSNDASSNARRRLPKKVETRKREQLGVSIGTASYRLRKVIFFKLLQETGKDTCFRCGLKIESEKELSLDHKIPWLDNSPELFWDIDNVAFSHGYCNVRAARRGTTESSLRKNRARRNCMVYRSSGLFAEGQVSKEQSALEWPWFYVQTLYLAVPETVLDLAARQRVSALTSNAEPESSQMRRA